MQKFIILCSALPIFVACATLPKRIERLGPMGQACFDKFEARVYREAALQETSCEAIKQIFEDKKDECQNKDGLSSDDDPCCAEGVLDGFKEIIHDYCPGVWDESEQDNSDGADSVSGTSTRP
jgi:hypothetical protein